MNGQDMLCPKCRGTMRSYERSGVTVDQCDDCRGLFFDRGEFERLAEAEDTHYRNQGMPGPAVDASSGPGTSDLLKAVVKAAGSTGGKKKGSKAGFLGQLLG